MPKEVPQRVIDLYKSGQMSSEDMDEFEALVESGEFIIPKSQPSQPVEDVQFAERPQFESSISAPEPIETQSFTGLKPIGFNPEVQEWPSEVSGVPTLRKDLFQQYQTRSIDQDTRVAIEEAISKGQLSIPEGRSLNIPKEWGEKSFGEKLHEFWNPKETIQASMKPDILTSKEAVMAGPGYLAAASLMPPEERAKSAINELNFKPIGRDFYGNPMLVSPEGKEYTIGPEGMKEGLAKGLAVAPASVIATKAALPLVAGKGALAAIAIMGLTEAGVESAIQTGQATYGGDFDKLDVAIAAGLSLAPDLTAEAFKSYGKRKLVKTVKDAAKGDAKALAKMDEMYKNHPEVIDIATESINVKYNPTTKSFEQSNNLKDSLEDFMRRPSSKYAKEGLGRSLAKDKDAMKLAEDLGVKDEMTLSEVVDYEDAQTRDLVQNIYSEGIGSIKAQRNARDAGLKQEFIDKMVKIGASKDKGAVSKEVKDFMTKRVYKNESDYRVLRDQIDQVVPERYGVKAEETLSFLEDEAKKWKPKLKEGQVLEGDGTNPFSAFENELRRALKPGRGKTVTEKVDALTLKPYGFDIEEEEVLKPIERLISLKRAAGNMKKDMTIATEDQFKAGRLYNMLKRDLEANVAKIGDEIGDPNLLTKWQEADSLWSQAKNEEEAMLSVFGKEFNDNMFRNVDQVNEELFNTGIEKLETIVNAIPEDKRSKVVKTVFLDAMGRNKDLMNIEGFGKWYDGFKDSSRGMMLLKKHMSPEDFSEFQAMGKLSSKIREATEVAKGSEGASKLKELIEPKKNLVTKIVSQAATYGAAGAITSLAIGLAPGTLGTIGIGLGVLGGVKAFRDSITESKFRLLTDFLKSKELMSIMENVDNKQVYVKSLSKMKKMKQIAKTFNLASDQKSLETFIKSTLKPIAREQVKVDNQGE